MFSILEKLIAQAPPFVIEGVGLTERESTAPCGALALVALHAQQAAQALGLPYLDHLRFVQDPNALFGFCLDPDSVRPHPECGVYGMLATVRYSLVLAQQQSAHPGMTDLDVLIHQESPLNAYRQHTDPATESHDAPGLG